LEKKLLPKSAYTEVHGFEARKISLNQDPKDGYYKLTIKIDPKDAPRWLLDASAGTPLAIGMRALDYDNPEPPQDNIGQRAALLCKNQKFQDWLAIKYDVDFTDTSRPADYWAAEFVCFHCGISSRSELRMNDNARKIFESLIDEFKEKRISFE
jgi:hypothetical protein